MTPCTRTPTLCRLVTLAALLALQACTSILHVPDGARYQSDDGNRLALVQQGRVVLDGQPQASVFDGVANSGVNFSPDGRRVAYIGMRGSKYFLVVDGREYGPFDGIAQAGVQFSPSGKRLSLYVVRDDRWQVWLDGALSPPYDGIISYPVYSRDESRVAFGARNGQAWSLVVDGVEQQPVKGLLDNFGFTASGELYAAYQLADGFRVRIGDRTSESFTAINKPGLIRSASGRAIAFIAARGQEVFVCVDLVCGPPHRQIGTRVLVDRSIFGDNFWKALGAGVVLGLVSGQAVSVSGGGSAHYTIVGSVVFSPDDRHHAYVASDTADVIVIDGSAARLAVPPGQTVESMRFDDSSQVLMARVSGDPSRVLVAPVPGAPRYDGAGAGAVATLRLTLPAADTLVFVNGRFAGLSPSTLQVPAGPLVLRVQAPGRLAKEVPVNAAPGQELTVVLDAPDDPVRAAVQSAIVKFDDPKLPLAAKAKRDHIWRGRILAQVPHSEEVIGVALYGAGADALIFGESAIYVHNEFSSRSNQPQSYVVDYADFARRPLPTDHRFGALTLAPGVVLKTAGMSLSKDRLIQFLELLRSELAAVPGLVPSSGKAP